MAARFQTTVYNEKGRKIEVSIKDNVFSGATYDFDTIGLQLQYDSESSARTRDGLLLLLAHVVHCLY
jgi:hypothetical protein